MADNSVGIMTVDVQANVKPFVSTIDTTINNAQKKVNSLKFDIDDKGASRALGRISASANEFNRSLDASNARVLAFGASLGVMYTFQRAMAEMVKSTIEVEKELTQINVILNASTNQIKNFGDSLFDIAKSTNQSFQSVAAAALELSRQGLNATETLKRTKDALILAQLSGLSATQSVEAITAALNSFNKTTMDSTQLISKLASVDQSFAVSTADLAEGIKRVGSTAQDAGVDINQLIALITAAQQTTSRGGTVIGNAFKTIFTRVQRPETLDQLDSLGIKVKDLYNNVLPANQILQQLAGSYDKLSQSQRSQVEELVGGVFQINILKASLNDLTKEYSIYNNALEISKNATNEATERSKALNDTLSASINRTVQNLTQIGAKLGDLSFSGPLKESITKVNSYLESSLSGDGESMGDKLGRGVAKGLGDFLGGPAILIAFSALGGIIGKVLRDVGGAFLSITNLNEASRVNETLRANAVKWLEKEPELFDRIIAGQATSLELQNSMVMSIEREISARKVAVEIAAGTQLKLAELGIGRLNRNTEVGGFQREKPNTLFNVGFIPTINERMGAYAGGYTPGEVRQLNIKGLGNAIYNTAETVKTFPGMSQPAIIPPKNSLAGINYQKNFQSKLGFNPYMAEGYMPEGWEYGMPIPKPNHNIGSMFSDLHKGPASNDWQGPNLQIQMNQALKDSIRQLQELSNATKVLTQSNLGARTELDNRTKEYINSARGRIRMSQDIPSGEIPDSLKELYGIKKPIGLESLTSQTKLRMAGQMTVQDMLNDPRVQSIVQSENAFRRQYTRPYTPSPILPVGMGEALLNPISTYGRPTVLSSIPRKATDFAKNPFQSISAMSESKRVNIGLAGAFLAPMAAETISQFAIGDSQTRAGRTGKEALSGIGTTASLGFAGLAYGPQAAAAGLAIGSAMTISKVLNTYSDKIPELKEALSKAQVRLNELGNSIQEFNSISEKIKQRTSGEVAYTDSELKGLQEDRLNTFSGFSDSSRKEIMEALNSGDTRKATEVMNREAQIVGEQSKSFGKSVGAATYSNPTIGRSFNLLTGGSGLLSSFSASGKQIDAYSPDKDERDSNKGFIESLLTQKNSKGATFQSYLSTNPAINKRFYKNLNSDIFDSDSIKGILQNFGVNMSSDDLDTFLIPLSNLNTKTGFLGNLGMQNDRSKNVRGEMAISYFNKLKEVKQVYHPAVQTYNYDRYNDFLKAESVYGLQSDLRDTSSYNQMGRYNSLAGLERSNLKAGYGDTTELESLRYSISPEDFKRRDLTNQLSHINRISDEQLKKQTDSVVTKFQENASKNLEKFLQDSIEERSVKTGGSHKQSKSDLETADTLGITSVYKNLVGKGDIKGAKDYINQTIGSYGRNLSFQSMLPGISTTSSLLGYNNFGEMIKGPLADKLNNATNPQNTAAVKFLRTQLETIDEFERQINTNTNISKQDRKKLITEARGKYIQEKATFDANIQEQLRINPILSKNESLKQRLGQGFDMSILSANANLASGKQLNDYNLGIRASLGPAAIGDLQTKYAISDINQNKSIRTSELQKTYIDNILEARKSLITNGILNSGITHFGNTIGNNVGDFTSGKIGISQFNTNIRGVIGGLENRKSGLDDSGKEEVSKTIDNLNKILNDYTNNVEKLDKETENQIQLLKTANELQQKRLEDTLNFTKRQFNLGNVGARQYQSDFSNLNNQKEANGNLGINDILGETGAKFAYNGKDALSDFRKAAVGTADDIKSAFSGAFSEFVKGSKTAKEAGKDFLMTFLGNQLNKYTEIGFNSLLGGISGLFGKKADGGLITGGSGAIDDVPTMLTGGEFVLTKRAVQSLGLGTLNSLNSNPPTANTLLTNRFVYNNENTPSIGNRLFSRSLSNYGLLDPSNPQNDIRAQREKSFFDFIHTRDAFNANAQAAASQARNQILQGGWMSAIMQVAGAGLSSMGRSSGGGSFGGTTGGKNVSMSGGEGLQGFAPRNVSNFAPYAAGGLVYGGQSMAGNTMGGEARITSSMVNKLGAGFLDGLNRGQNIIQPNNQLQPYVTNPVVAVSQNPVSASSNNTMNKTNNNSFSFSINIDKNNNSSVASKDNKNQNQDDESERLRKFNDSFKSKVLEIVTQEQRPGGLLYS